MNDNDDLNIFLELELNKCCDWDKRKKCDSLYIKREKDLKKKIYKVLEIVEKCTDEKVKKEIKRILENI